MGDTQEGGQLHLGAGLDALQRVPADPSRQPDVVLSQVLPEALVSDASSDFPTTGGDPLVIVGQVSHSGHAEAGVIICLPRLLGFLRSWRHGITLSG